MVFAPSVCSVRKCTFARPMRPQRRIVLARADEVGIPKINEDIRKDEEKVTDTVNVGKSPELATQVRGSAARAMLVPLRILPLITSRT